jgi:hypothetical protein
MENTRVICFTAIEASSDGLWTPCVRMWSRSLHLAAWFENEQVPPPQDKTRPLAARISARQLACFLDLPHTSESASISEHKGVFDY